MKKHLLLFPAIMAAFFATAQTASTDLAIQNLKGKVRSVNETVYEATEKFGEVEKGTKTDRYYQEYNSAGMELQYLQESYDEGEKDKFVRTARYENDKLAEMKEDDNGDVELSRYKYNQQGLLESIDGLDRKDNLLYRQKNKYNADGLLTQADSYKGDGSLEIRTVNSYNAKKQVVKKEWYDQDGKLTRLQTYVYDGRGKVVEESSIDYKRKEQKPYIRKYAYNDKNQKIEERNSIAGLDHKEIYE